MAGNYKVIINVYNSTHLVIYIVCIWQPLSVPELSFYDVMPKPQDWVLIDLANTLGTADSKGMPPPL